MEFITLNKFVRFTLGQNPTRIREHKEPIDDLYTPDDFEKDLHSINSVKESLGCIINLINSKCSPVSEQTAMKCITLNFLKCDFDTEKIFPWYLCYQFNEGKDLERQIKKYLQGTTLSVKKLNIKTIGELKISLPDIEKQRLIGNLYRQLIIQNDLMIKQANDIKKFTMAIIRKMEGE